MGAAKASHSCSPSTPYAPIMSTLTITQKTLLESVLKMKSGYVLDFTDGSFGNFFSDVGINIFDDEKYSGLGVSKANRLRALWKVGSDAEVSAVLDAIAEYLEAKESVGEPCEGISGDQISKIREIARELGRDGTSTSSAPVPITSEATVTKSRISIEIHADIYSHIERNLETADYFHAVEESYKLVREKLRELTGKEKASDVFSPAATNKTHYEALFGRASARTGAEDDFFRGVGYLHLGVQFLRNEKVHTLATPVEPNLALHYISLASLAYDLITRYVSEETIKEIEDRVHAKRRSYMSATAFYRDFANGKWLQSIEIPALRSASVRKALKEKWLDEADFTRSWDHSNVVLMRLELVVDELTEVDVDRLLALPTTNSHGHDQQAGMLPFLEFVQQRCPDRLSPTAEAWIADQK